MANPPPRIGERTDYSKIHGELARTQTLFRPTEDSSVALHLAAKGQYAANLLPPAEKFYLGGASFNRGFYYGQVTGDHGAAATAELRFNTPLPAPDFLPMKLSAQFYGFYDWGRVWQKTSTEADVSLQSAGGGVRLYAGDRTEIDLEGVFRQSRFPSGRGPGVSALNEAAFYWQVLFRY